MTMKILTTLSGLLLITSLNAQVSDSGLVACYPFNGNTNDSSTNANHGSNNGVTFAIDGNRNVGQFTSTSYVEIPDNSSFDFSTASGVTIESWVKQEEAAYGYIIAKMGTGGSSDDEYSLIITANGQLQGSFNSPSTHITLESKTKLALSTWYHVVLIWNQINGQITFYINGEIDVTTSSAVSSLQNTNVAFRIGQFLNAFENSFIGSIDDLKIYRKALSASEILESYHGCMDDLVAYYPFNGNANDESGNGYVGNVSGTTYTSDRFSNADKAIHFSGGSTHVALANSENIILNESFSVCFWIKQEAYGHIIERDIIGTTSTDWYIWSYEDGSIRLSLGTSDGAKSETHINDNSWHHVVFLRNKSTGTIKIYIDGTLDKEESGWTNDLTGDAQVNFGAWDTPEGFEEGFTGILDEIRLYNFELSAAEISDLYDIQPAAINSLCIPNHLYVFPNPVTSEMNIGLSLEKEHSYFQILDTEGRLVLDGELSAECNTIHLEFLKSGLYIINVFDGSEMIITKFLKR
jgi:hypothetical protein